MSNKKHFLGMITYFKNEGHILYEWILHYKKWGVNHIWLIDNGSEDNYNVEEFINEGFITIFKEPLLEQQSAYDKYIPKIKNEVIWVCNCDLDEFLYSKENQDLKFILENNIGKNIDIVSIQMTIFFPCTFETPASVIEKNVKRKCFDSDKYPKCIYNLDKLKNITIHGTNSKNKLHLTADKTLLCINHYRYTSFEYLYGIKEGRGCNPSKSSKPIHKSKYDVTYGHKFMTLINSLDDNFLSDDTYLKNNSKDVIDKCYKKNTKPKINLYPKSSWLYLKNNLRDEYNKFSNYNNHNRLLTHNEINEINIFMNNLKKSL